VPLPNSGSGRDSVSSNIWGYLRQKWWGGSVSCDNRGELPSHDPTIHITCVKPVVFKAFDYTKVEPRKKRGSAILSSPPPTSIDPVVFGAYVTWVLMESNLSTFKQEGDVFDKVHHRHWATTFKKKQML